MLGKREMIKFFFSPELTSWVHWEKKRERYSTNENWWIQKNYIQCQNSIILNIRKETTCI